MIAMVRSSSKRLAAALVVFAGLVAIFTPLAHPVHASDGPPTPCPPEMAFTAGICMDRYEAHLLERGEDGSLTPFPPFARPKKQGTFVAESRAGVRPQGYISQLEAASACRNAGKRLCAVNEWYRACRGAQDARYPYGATYERGRCNVGKPHLLSMLHGSDPNAWSYEKAFNDPALDRRPGFLAETGEYSGCVTSAGVFDLVGNLHEWVADRVDESIAQKLPLKAGIRARLGRNRGKGVFMGGFFSTSNEHGNGCEFVTMAHEPSYHDYSTGFRCCKDP
jgi:formylglycine-generating enzyme